MALYSNLFVFIDGQLLAENATVETSIERRSDPVFSFEDNYEGEDIGPATRIISATSFVPMVGTEYPFEKKFINGEEVEIVLQEPLEGKSVLTRGRFVAVSRIAGTRQSYMVNFTFRGTPGTFDS